METLRFKSNYEDSVFTFGEKKFMFDGRKLYSSDLSINNTVPVWRQYIDEDIKRIFIDDNLNIMVIVLESEIIILSVSSNGLITKTIDFGKDFIIHYVVIGTHLHVRGEGNRGLVNTTFSLSDVIFPEFKVLKNAPYMTCGEETNKETEEIMIPVSGLMDKIANPVDSCLKTQFKLNFYKDTDDVDKETEELPELMNEACKLFLNFIHGNESSDECREDKIDENVVDLEKQKMIDRIENRNLRILEALGDMLKYYKRRPVNVEYLEKIRLIESVKSLICNCTDAEYLDGLIGSFVMPYWYIAFHSKNFFNINHQPQVFNVVAQKNLETYENMLGDIIKVLMDIKSTLKSPLETQEFPEEEKTEDVPNEEVDKALDELLSQKSTCCKSKNVSVDNGADNLNEVRIGYAFDIHKQIRHDIRDYKRNEFRRKKNLNKDY